MTNYEIPGVYNLLAIIKQIAENLQAGHHVWGGGVGANAVRSPLDGELYYEVVSPDAEGEDDIRLFESTTDAAWDLLRRSGGVPLSIQRREVQVESVGCKGEWSSENGCCGLCLVHRNDHDLGASVGA